MKIIHYPHPTLRVKSEPVKAVNAALKKTVEQMLELMYENKGVGLAANQVDIPQRFFVMNLTADPKAKEQEIVFINPVISKHKGSDDDEEGCLSLPGVYAQVRRPKRIHLNAYNLAGQEVNIDLDSLVARIVQHETDHLDGVLFIDRINPLARADIKGLLEDFELAFKK